MNRKLFLLQSLAVIVLLLSFVLPGSAAAAESRCSQLAAWVESNAKSLPRTYEGLAQYPTPYRRAIFSALEPEVKSRIWRAHLERFLSNQDGLTSAQRELVERAIDLTSPDFFSLEKGDAQWDELVAQRVADFERDARQHFSSEQMRQLFAQLGSKERGAKPGLQLMTGADQTDGVQCSCSVESDWCGSGHDCWYATCDQVNGCGTFWSYRCNGLCFAP